MLQHGPSQPRMLRVIADAKEDFGKKLRATQMLHDPSDLMRNSWPAFLFSWAGKVRVTMAPVEFKHRQNRGIAHPHMTFDHFAAACLNSGAKQIYRTSQRYLEQQSLAGPGARAIQDTFVWPGTARVCSILSAAQSINPGPQSFPRKCPGRERDIACPCRV